ncbi:MAG: type II CRISPR-associated endonuclease Cas1 [Prolixibacteraceae bacterium]|jgi:CRISPR-associated protein Cas1|nr:type II CRISPR-associated endonuclease Cas1 [Prolixibacteraceae bacterium]
MIKRTLYFGNPAYIHKKNQQLKVIDPENREELGSIPIEDIGVVILDNPQITFTHGLMEALLARNTVIVSCDEKHLPVGLMLPLVGHTLQSERFRYQIDASEPLKKNLWAQTIKSKIDNQAEVLRRNGLDSLRLDALLPQIQSGDPDNIEGRAASVYWKLLFDGIEFKRDRYGSFPNPHLNYCYAILRAIVARAIVSSGMLPTFGIFHRNKYNAYCLADDIMEPYRPFCDQLVYDMVLKSEINDDEITKEHKVKLLSIATVDIKIAGAKSPLMVGLNRTTASLFECYQGSRRKIVYPEFLD